MVLIFGNNVLKQQIKSKKISLWKSKKRLHFNKEILRNTIKEITILSTVGFM